MGFEEDVQKKMEELKQQAKQEQYHNNVLGVAKQGIKMEQIKRKQESDLQTISDQINNIENEIQERSEYVVQYYRWEDTLCKCIIDNNINCNGNDIIRKLGCATSGYTEIEISVLEIFKQFFIVETDKIINDYNNKFPNDKITKSKEAPGNFNPFTHDYRIWLSVYSHIKDRTTRYLKDLEIRKSDLHISKNRLSVQYGYNI